MRNFLTVYINQHEFLLMSFFECLITCNVKKIAWVVDVNNRYLRQHFFCFNYWENVAKV